MFNAYQYEVWPSEDLSSSSRRRDAAALILALWAHAQDEINPRRLLNVGPLVEVPTFRQANKALCLQIHGPNADIRGSLAANITPRNALTEMHFDDAPSISTLIGGEKLWIIYPASQLRVLLFAQQHGYDTRRCLELMQGGVYIHQKHGDKIYIPAFAPHCVLTLRSSTLVGHILDVELDLSQILCLIDGGLDALLRTQTVVGRTDLRYQFCAHIADALERQEWVDQILLIWSQNEMHLQVLYSEIPECWEKLYQAFQACLCSRGKCGLCATRGVARPLSRLLFGESNDHVRSHFRMQEHSLEHCKKRRR